MKSRKLSTENVRTLSRHVHRRRLWLRSNGGRSFIYTGRWQVWTQRRMYHYNVTIPRIRTYHVVFWVSPPRRPSPDMGSVCPTTLSIDRPLSATFRNVRGSLAYVSCMPSCVQIACRPSEKSSSGVHAWKRAMSMISYYSHSGRVLRGSSLQSFDYRDIHSSRRGLLYPPPWSLLYNRPSPYNPLSLLRALLSKALRAAPRRTGQDVRACDGEHRHGGGEAKERGEEFTTLASRTI